MKVVQINAIYGSKSTGVIMKDIHNMLVECGEESYVVSPEFTEKTDCAYKIENYVGMKIHALMTRITGKQAFYSSRATRKLIRWMDEVKPDIVHLHNLHGNYINLRILLEFLCKKEIAVVITMHDCWYFTGKCFHYLESNCQKWQIECDECPRKNDDVANWFLDKSNYVFQEKKRLLLQIPNLTMVGPSRWICGEAKKSFLKEKRIECIYNGIDTSIFNSKSKTVKGKYCPNAEFIILGMADKWTNIQNREIVGKVVSSLQENEVILLVGDKCALNELQSSKIVSIPYVYDRNELAEIYSMADVFLNLSLADTFPTVNMEAICCGTPVITYDVGGCKETIKEGTGYVVPVNEADEVLAAIDMIRMHSLKNCEDIGKDNFSKEKQYCQYLGLYHSILNGK